MEHHTHFYVYVSQQSQVQFEDEDHTIYTSFHWVTTTCHRWEPQPVTLWLYPVIIACDVHTNVLLCSNTGHVHKAPEGKTEV